MSGKGVRDNRVVTQDSSRQPRSAGLVVAPRFFRDATERPEGLELFFDLVFVLAIAQVARLVRADPSERTAAIAVLVLLPVWWAWVGITFVDDRFPTDDVLHRCLVLAAAAAAGVMALAWTGFPTRGAPEFAAGYATVRLLLVVLYSRAARAVGSAAPQARAYAIGFAAVAGVWLVSIAVPPPARWALWGLAMAMDIAVPAVTDRRLGLLPVDTTHLPNRFGAFVILVLGESVLTTAALTADLQHPFTRTRIVVLAEGFLLAAALWWGFFDRGAWQRRYHQLAGDSSGRLANIVCAYLHLPLVAGVVFVAVGVQLSTVHPDVSTALIRAALTGGIAAYLLAMNFMAFVLHIPRGQSLIALRLVLIAVLAVVLIAGRVMTVPAFLGACLLIALAHVAANLHRATTHASPDAAAVAVQSPP